MGTSICKLENKTLEKITNDINEAESAEQKVALAQKLLEEIKKLEGNEHFQECEICASIAKLRKRAANLIIKAKNLK